MKINHILQENTIESDLKSDASLVKRLAIMWNHDLPDRLILARLGPNPTADQIATAWLSMVNLEISRTLARGDYLKRNSNAMKWLLKQYLLGTVGFSSTIFDNDIEGLVESLNMWCILLVKGNLKENHRDLNKISNPSLLSRIVDLYDISKVKREIEQEYLMKEQLELVLIDDSEFKVSIPLSYGACRKFNLTGHTSSFCTGSSSGANYFTSYSSGGPLIMISHKPTISTPEGKIQISAESDELQTSNGNDISTRKLESLYPGILKRIIDAMTAESDKITNEMRRLTSSKAYRATSTINILKRWLAALPKDKK